MITFYTCHCEECNLIKSVMDNKKIQYKEVDNEKIYLPIADANNIKFMPFADIDGNIYNAKEFKSYIMEEINEKQ